MKISPSYPAIMKRRRMGIQLTAFLSLCPVQPAAFLHHNPSSSSLSPRSSPISTHSKTNASHTPHRLTISANSLEDSKRRAKSSYDNIPDLNQQYIAELNWVERKYGPKRLKNKDILKESQTSILRPDGVAQPTTRNPAPTDAPSQADADLSQYKALRNQLFSNTLFVGGLGACAFWGFGTARDAASFAIGLAGSLAYVALLSRSVDRLAEGAKTAGVSGGDALQPARIAVLVLLVLASAKNREHVAILPVLFGFFAYKAATLLPLLTGEAFDYVDG